jgi:hypothetical protein
MDNGNPREVNEKRYFHDFIGVVFPLVVNGRTVGC